ncbi:MAG: hypothetical protein FWG12_06860 [Holophagaceae bacterium]|nr:hypothetical protein [Holophagaceae bacterium]
MATETMQPAAALAEQICQDRAFQAALTAVIETYLDDGWRASTPEEIRQASADYKTGRIQGISHDELKRQANAV